MTEFVFAYTPCDWYWIIGGDETQVYSSARATKVPVSDAAYQAWFDPTSERMPTRIAAMDDLIDVLRKASVPPYHRVRKSTIVSRLGDEKALAARALMKDTIKELRWNVADQPAVNADDPDMIAMVRAVGADPAAVLAPE